MSGTPGPVRRRLAAALAAGALLAPVLAGCGDSPEPAGDGPALTHAVATTPRAELTRGSVVTWAVDGVPATLNAHHRDATPVTTQVAGAVMPMLFTLDAHGRPRRNGDYLRAAEVTAREPKQKVVYTLHPKAEWSDGSAIGAADFRAQWQALSGEDPSFRAAGAAGYDRIASIAAGPGKHQVTVTFARPCAEWRALFTPLYPRAVTSEPDRFNDPAAAASSSSDGADADGAEQPPGAGPFRVEDVDRTAGTVTLARNRAWWGDPALLDELVFAAVPPDEREAALLAGTVDVAAIGTAEADRIAAAQLGPPIKAKERENSQRLRRYVVYRAYDAGYTQLTLNGAAGPLRDERVRWAVARALDREALARHVHDPAGLPVTPLGNHLRVLGQAGYQDNSTTLGEGGRQSAADLLDEAGWRLGRGAGGGGDGGSDGGSDVEELAAAAPGAVRTKDEKRLSLRFLLPSGTEAETGQLRDTGRRVAAMLADVGIRAEITRVPAEELLAERIPGGDFDLALYSWPATAYPATDAAPLFAKPQALPGGDQLTGQNYTRLGTDYIDQLLQQAAGEQDTDEYERLLNEADTQIWALAGSLPLYQQPQLVAARTNLAGVGAHGLATPRYQDIGYRR